MRLHYYRHRDSLINFGDDLNPWFFNSLMPGLLDGHSSRLLVGIGSLINESLPQAEELAFFGTGVGYNFRPVCVQPNWKIYFVRGPLSARALNLPEDCGITDAAMFVRRLIKESTTKTIKRSYMPHVGQTLKNSEVFESICMNCGLHYIDPRNPIEDVLREINETEILYTEALHGAVVADALSVPWVPMVSHSGVYRFKWEDWCASIGVPYDPFNVSPFWTPDKDDSLLRKLRYQAKLKVVAAQFRVVQKQRRPILSNRKRLDYLLDRIAEKGESLKQDIIAYRGMAPGAGRRLGSDK